VKTNDPNLKTLYVVFNNLKSDKYNKDNLYADYFLQADKGQPDRPDNDKVFYKDSLFKQFHELLNKSISYDFLPLQKAKEKIGVSIIENDYYYEAQKNTIYVFWTNIEGKNYDTINYFLMDNGKIVSLYPYTQDKKLFWWR